MLLLYCPYLLFSVKSFFFSVLLSPALFVESTEVTGAKAQSSSHLVSPVCINVEDSSLADRFLLIDESKDVVPASQLFSPSLAPQRASLLSDIAADQRRKNTVNLQSEPLKVQLSSFLSLTEEDDFDFW